MKLELDKYNTLCNVGNSILKRFNVKPFHDTFKPLDEILNKTNKKKVCLVLFDAFGKYIIEKYKNDIPYIYNHKHIDFLSIYPPTTVAATTSLLSGKYPIETGYLGWTQYFKEYNDEIDVFPSKSKFNKKQYNPSIQDSLLKVDKLWDLINKENNKEIAKGIYSIKFKDGILSDKDVLTKLFDETNKELKNHDFVYCYSEEPDHTMHENGVNNKKTKEMIMFLENKLKELVKQNTDVLFILIADHGMVDVKQYYFNDYKEFANTLKTPYVSIEPRFAAFNVKDNKKFEEYYNENLKEKFILKTKQQIIEEHTFGYGTPHALFNDFLKDYFIISKEDYVLNDGLKGNPLKATHAGINEKELKLYMTIFDD